MTKKTEITTKFDPKVIDSIIEEEMGEMKIPGLSIVIVKGTEPIYVKGFGKISDKGGKVTGKTAFFIGSSSKSFTATAIMQLSEKGLLVIDEPAKKYLPWFCLADEEASKKITLRQLLNHTSGISTYEGNKAFNHNAAETLEQLTHNLKKVKLNRVVGASFEYSNLNYIILGEVIQAVSGLSYEEYIEKNIFSPLEMSHSFASKQKSDEYGLKPGHQPVLGFIHETKYEFHPAITPAGYLTTCASDMANYLIAQLNGGHYKNAQILSEEGVSMMHSKSSETSELYGLGWFDNGRLVHHGGSAENYHANMMLVPEEKIGIVIEYNINDNFSGAFIKGTFADGETIRYDRIQSRIVNYMMGEDLISPIVGRGKSFHVIADAVFLLIYAALAWLAVAAFQTSSFSVANLLYAILPLVFSIFLFNALPRAFGATWKAMFRFAAGPGQAIFMIPFALSAIGGIKLILLLLSIAA